MKFTEQEQQAIYKYIEEQGVKKIPIGKSGKKKPTWTLKEEDFQEFMMDHHSFYAPRKELNTGSFVKRRLKTSTEE